MAVTPSKLHKARRGYGLLGLGEAEKERAPAPAFSENVVLTDQMSGVDALRAVGNAAVEQILTNWDFVLVDSAPEGPHQLRVGLRRLRTALHMLGAKALASELTDLEKLAQELAGIVGELRDADVLLRDIFVPAASGLSEISDENPLRTLLLADIEEKRAPNPKELGKCRLDPSETQLSAV